MRRLYHDFRETSRGRPFLVLLGIIYAVIPLVLISVAVFSVIQRQEIRHEAKRNCQRAAAIANFIRDTVPMNAQGEVPARLRKLERTLRSIGACPT